MKKYLLLLLLGCLIFSGCDKTATFSETEKWSLIPMVMVDDTLYLDTGYENSAVGRCGVMDGEITSTVEGTERPAKNGQSNFGTGYGYQYGAVAGTIEIYMNDSWWIFATEEVKAARTFLPASDTTSELPDWGITLSVQDVTPTGLIIFCMQSGGNPTGELYTGSYYVVEKWQDNAWIPLEYKKDAFGNTQNIAWTGEAWFIPINGKTDWGTDWEWLYGALPAGRYRVGKEIMDFRGTRDYDQALFYVEFRIEE